MFSEGFGAIVLLSFALTWTKTTKGAKYQTLIALVILNQWVLTFMAYEPL